MERAKQKKKSRGLHGAGTNRTQGPTREIKKITPGRYYSREKKNYKVRVRGAGSHKFGWFNCFQLECPSANGDVDLLLTLIASSQSV